MPIRGGGGGTTDHGLLTGLADDDHTQYVLLAGRAGGQTIYGGTAASENLTLQSTFHATKGSIILGSASAYDQVNDRLGIGITVPTARLHLPAGAAAAGNAPLKFTSGTSLGSAVAGSMEFTTDNLFFTITTSTSRKRLLMADATTGLTSTRVPFATTNGRLTDVSTFTFASSVLTVPDLTDSALTLGRVVFPTTGGKLTGSANLFWTNASNRLGVGTPAPTCTLDVTNVDGTALDTMLVNANTSGAWTPGTSYSGLNVALNDSMTGDPAGGSLSGVYIVGNTGNNFPAGANLYGLFGVNAQVNLNTSNDVTIDSLFGLFFLGQLGGTAGTYCSVGGGSKSVVTLGGITIGTMAGAVSTVHVFTGTASTIYGFLAEGYGIAWGGTADQAVAFGVTATFAGDAGVYTWSGLQIPTITGPTVIWGLDITGTMNNRIAGKLSLGSTTAPTAWASLAAGTTTVPPLRLTSGTSLTSPLAGAIEFTTDDFFATITTGSARKAFVLDDGTRLTSGRVPFATTNGRLTDDSDLTFATDTLTATKIVASTSLAVAAGAAITELVRTTSGVYTPTLTNVANLTASTAYQCQYMRVGATVTVSGKVDVDPTAALATQLGISLPIASNIGAEEDCGGTAFSKAIAGQGAAIFGDAANNRAQMEWLAVNLTNQPMYFSFTYRII